MRHIIIQIESLMKYPPSLSLIRMLHELGEDVYFFSAEVSDRVRQNCINENVNLINLKYTYDTKNPAAEKLIKIPLINYQIKKNLKKYYTRNTIIWVMTSVTLKYIGKNLFGKNYIMYMYELSQELRYYQKFRYPCVNLEKLFKNAIAVIECEYNRAHIAQAWFGLSQTPYVLPNKPYMSKLNRYSFIEDEYCRTVMEQIKDRKIILYQGIIDEERPLNPFIEAVNELGAEYAMVIMSGDYKNVKSAKSDNLFLLPFVNPPHHLEITSWAYIGILSYFPVRNAATSPLNAIYCAPNKIYEYAMFGIPMLGNDIPGLQYSVQNNKMGICLPSFSRKDIIGAIKCIKKNYSMYSRNAELFYDEICNKDVLKEIITGEKSNVCKG